MGSSAKIRRLVLVEGRSIRSISRETGLSRNTIKKYVNDPSPPCYRRTNLNRPGFTGEVFVQMLSSFIMGFHAFIE